VVLTIWMMIIVMNVRVMEMTEKKTKEEILHDIDQEFENCCINIFNNLQANEITLTGTEIWKLIDDFKLKLDRQNNKVIVTGDGKYH